MFLFLTLKEKPSKEKRSVTVSTTEALVEEAAFTSCNILKLLNLSFLSWDKRGHRDAASRATNGYYDGRLLSFTWEREERAGWDVGGEDGDFYL